MSRGDRSGEQLCHLEKPKQKLKTKTSSSRLLHHGIAVIFVFNQRETGRVHRGGGSTVVH